MDERAVAIGFCLLCLALLFVPMAVRDARAAGMYPLATGELPKLDADEGLLLVSVDTEQPLEAVYMKQEGALLKSRVLRKAAAGRASTLVRVAAGRYGWSTLRVGDWARSGYWADFNLDDDPESYFDVRAGVVNYPGDLVVKSIDGRHAYIQSMNHGLLAIDWLDSNYPGLLEKRELVYSGHYADPFPAFYLKARKAGGLSREPTGKLLAPPEPGELTLSPKVLWKQEHLNRISLNPAGDLLALQLRKEGKQVWTVELVDLKASESHIVARTDIPFENMRWSGDSALLLDVSAAKLSTGGINQRDSDSVVSVVHVGRDANGKRTYDAWQVPRRGRILDVLDHDPDHVLFATTGVSGYLLVHRLDISSKQALARFSPETTPTLNPEGEGEYWWLVDGAGDLSVAYTQRDSEFVLSRLNGKHLEEFLAIGEGSNFSPLALSDDGSTLYAITDDDRDQRELVAYDIPSRAIAKTLFSKVGTDVESVIFGAGNRPLGVRYYEDGRLTSDYFGVADRRRLQALRKAFPGKSVTVIDKSIDDHQLILSVEGSDSTPKLYHLDATAGRAELIEDTAPWLKGARFVPSQVVSATSKDGLPIEAYLTIPDRGGKSPMVVMPHGGPVGISDHLHFDRDTQFLASLGYAVLRVNYRGSDGYGKSFREAGYQQSGTAIEDDIDAVLTRVLADYPIDPRRMCMLGFSYGGYSALISTVRWPDRFRCAISVSGVADRILQFTASDSVRTADRRQSLSQWWGDPIADRDALIATSPVYHYHDIKIPVMLVHGDDDIRVDPEQTRRMQRMLELDGRPPTGLMIEGDGHSFEHLANIDTLWRGIAGFLREYLDEAGAQPAAAAVARP
jgi:dipeptidyl aminopeptidase/acylaminoacyl peptidase